MFAIYYNLYKILSEKFAHGIFVLQEILTVELL